jgi:hypothetical protein
MHESCREKWDEPIGQRKFGDQSCAMKLKKLVYKRPNMNTKLSWLPKWNHIADVYIFM